MMKHNIVNPTLMFFSRWVFDVSALISATCCLKIDKFQAFGYLSRDMLIGVLDLIEGAGKLASSPALLC
jgi:hypothetical protein